MTQKQSDFMVRLVNERDVTSLSDEQQQYIVRVIQGLSVPTPAQASRIIDALLALPRKADPVETSPDVPAGRYAVVNPSSGVTEFFKVDRPEDGKWAGYVFVKQQASDDLYPVKGARRDEVLARIAVDHRAAMVLYGHELGACGNCGRTLTDEVSRAMGIGPDCAAKLGIARIALEDVVQTPPSAPQGDVSDDEDYAFGGAARADAAAEEAAERAEVTDVTIRREPKLGWRETKAAVKAQQSDAETARGEWRARAAATGRIHDGELPGTTWEDIFGGGA
jgi:hypothetical protein